MAMIGFDVEYGEKIRGVYINPAQVISVFPLEKGCQVVMSNSLTYYATASAREVVGWINHELHREINVDVSGRVETYGGSA